jgi:hypothetical protein
MHKKGSSKLQSTKPEINGAPPCDARGLGNIRAIGSRACSSGVRILQSPPISTFLEAGIAKFEGSWSITPIHTKNRSDTPSFGPGNIGDDYLKSPSFGVDVPLASYAGVPSLSSCSNRDSEAEIGLLTTRCSMPVISRKLVDSARRAYITHASADRLKHMELDSNLPAEAMPTPILTVDEPLRRRRKLSKKKPKKPKKPKRSLA